MDYHLLVDQQCLEAFGCYLKFNPSPLQIFGAWILGKSTTEHAENEQ